MPRHKLPDRRMTLTTSVIHKTAAGHEEHHLISVGFNNAGSVAEVFSANRMVGSDMHAIIADGCILMSIYLQTGGELERLVRSLGENRQEGEQRGPASSVFGSIARKLLEIEREMVSDV